MSLTLNESFLLPADLLGHLLPLLVTILSLRRMMLSRGLSRWICGYVAVFSVGMLGFLLSSGGTDAPSHLAVLTCAWLTLPFWLFIRYACLTDQPRPSPEIQPGV